MHPLPAIQFWFAVEVNTPENQTKPYFSIPAEQHDGVDLTVLELKLNLW